MVSESFSAPQETFDPLRRVRRSYAETKDAYDLDEGYGTKRSKLGRSFVEWTNFALQKTESKGVATLDQIQEKLKDPELTESIVQRITEITPGSKFPFLQGESIKMTYEVADKYLAFVQRLIAQKQQLRSEGADDRKASSLNICNEGYALAELVRDGGLKDSLTFLTPHQHRFRANYDRAISAVNELLGIKYDAYLEFGEIDVPEAHTLLN